MKQILLVIFLLKIAGASQAQMTIVSTGPTLIPNALVQKLLGPGVSATNAVYSGSMLSKGRFYGASFDSIQAGIILTNGIVNSLIADSAAILLSDDMATSGDTLLDALITPLQTFDAAKLEFDLNAVSDSFQLEFMYASEDYNDLVNFSNNDLIGIFLSGPGIVGEQNIAVIPGTATPVNVNSVNNGQATAGMANGPCTNCQYYVDNDGGNNFAFDGYTIPIIAKTVVQPCQEYHIKIVIADVGNPFSNSAILIKEGSLKSLGQIDFFVNGMPSNNNDTIKKCPGDTITLSLNAASNYNWSTGASTQGIVVIAPQAGTAPVQYSAFITNPPVYSCFSWTTTIWVQSDTSYCNTAGIFNINSKNTLATLIPNPFFQSAVLSFDNPTREKMILKIYGADGTVVKQDISYEEQFIINKENLKAGIYFYEISNIAAAIIYSGKMMVQ